MSPIYSVWFGEAVPLPEKTALVSSVDATVVEPVQKPEEGGH